MQFGSDLSAWVNVLDAQVRQRYTGIAFLIGNVYNPISAKIQLGGILKRGHAIGKYGDVSADNGRYTSLCDVHVYVNILAVAGSWCKINTLKYLLNLFSVSYELPQRAVVSMCYSDTGDRVICE